MLSSAVEERALKKGRATARQQLAYPPASAAPANRETQKMHRSRGSGSFAHPAMSRLCHKRCLAVELHERRVVAVVPLDDPSWLAPRPAKCLSVPLGTTWSRTRTGGRMSTALSATAGPQSCSESKTSRSSPLWLANGQDRQREPDCICFFLSLSRADSPPKSLSSKIHAMKAGLVSCCDTRRKHGFGLGGLGGLAVCFL